MNYETFLASKRIVSEASGFVVDRVHPILYDFQADIVRWALRRGRAAMFEDCGLGKSLQQLEWARHVSERGPVLIVAPLSVAEQTIEEAVKLGMDVRYVSGLSEVRTGVQITNYEMLHHFVGVDAAGIVLDESSILKSIDGETKKLLIDQFTHIPYRLCCTATPCPNDIAELANHSEFLGILKRTDMLASFFVHDEDGWRLRGHAAKPFYRWLASWAMSMKSPADLGYDASRFILPPLHIHDEIVETEWRRPGSLFPGDLKGITDRASVRKQSVPDRVKRAADIANSASGQVIVFCGLNDESEAVAALIPDCVEITGADSKESKLDKIQRFKRGDVRVQVSKIRITGFGMNFQCADTVICLGMSDSYEAYYQGIRRVWRYGQKKPVHVYIVVTDHETEIVDNVRRKEHAAEELSREIVMASKEYEMEELGKNRHVEVMAKADYSGQSWGLMQGDACERMRELPESSVDLSVFSPPFLSLYQYSASEADLGNSKDPAIFFQHFRFVIAQLLRITKPGRLACVHVAQVATTLNTHGVIGLSDFRGKTIEQFQAEGWVYHGEVCIDKDPQAQAIRTHAKGLMFVQLKKDSSWLRPAMADYILVFRKPGTNAIAIHPDINNEDWIEWARPIWYGIRESETLNTAEARSDEDDRHICALQLGTIERCIRLWSNSGEVVFSPFAGIGSEGYVALKHDRKFIGCELKPLYARTAARNLAAAERALEQQPSLYAETAP
jgi:DNA modification methylase/superfamily II DNA or RNA helicase